MADIEDVIKKKRFMSVKDALYYFDVKYPGTDKKQIRTLFDKYHKKKFLKHYNRALMGNLFSSMKDAYQMDIFFDDAPYLLCVNINTRFAWISKLKSKNTNDVLDKFKKFVDELHPSGIQCDAESAFSSFRFVDFCRENHIIIRVVLGSLHSELAIINRLCRTLREIMDHYEVSVKQAVKKYNKKYNDAIKMSPRDMQANPDAELMYVYNQLEIRDKKEHLLLKDPIKKHDKVRYILDEQEHRFKKGQYKRQLSKYYYLVEYEHSPFLYDIVAENGDVKTVPRYRLIKVNDTDDIDFAPKLEDKSNFMIYDEIIDYKPVFKKNGDLNVNKSKYIVRVISRDKSGKKIKREEKLGIFQIRIGKPTELCNMEKEFLERHKDKYKLDVKTNLILPI